MCAPISNWLLHGISQVAEACHLEKVDTVEESDVDESALQQLVSNLILPFLLGYSHQGHQSRSRKSWSSNRREPGRDS